MVLDPPDPSLSGESAAFYDPEKLAPQTRRMVLLLMAMMFYLGYCAAIPAIAAPWIARSFHLDQAALARVFAWLALASLGSLGLSRMADRAGRRRVLLWSMSATPVLSLGAGLAASLAWFVAFEIALNAFLGAAAASAIVVLAETLPIARRARGQSLAGIAGVAGSGVCLMLMPLLVQFGWSWRWLLGLAAAGVVLFPALARAMPESRRWERAADLGAAARTRFQDIFVPLYRRRSLALTVCSLLGSVAGEGIGSWGYFHAVSVVGMSAAVASTMMFFAGGLGMLGFPAGAWSAERFGRVPTIVWSGIALAGGSLLFFWGPPARFAYPIVWMFASFFFLNAVSNAVTVASNAAATELYPTALRGTMIGWFALLSAIGSLSAEATISVLAKPLGGLSWVVGWLAMLAVPSSIIFGLTIDETRGLSLEAAASEEAFDRRERRTR